MALLGVARLSRFVPQPVLAGFMNGVAVLILLAQLPLLMGQPPGGATGWQAIRRRSPAHWCWAWRRPCCCGKRRGAGRASRSCWWRC